MTHQVYEVLDLVLHCDGEGCDNYGHFKCDKPCTTTQIEDLARINGWDVHVTTCYCPECKKKRGTWKE